MRINNTVVKFTIKKFATITGLRCIDDKCDFNILKNTLNRLILEYFWRKYNCEEERSSLVFVDKKWDDNNQDAIKIVLLYKHLHF